MSVRSQDALAALALIVPTCVMFNALFDASIQPQLDPHGILPTILYTASTLAFAWGGSYVFVRSIPLMVNWSEYLIDRGLLTALRVVTANIICIDIPIVSGLAGSAVGVGVTSLSVHPLGAGSNVPLRAQFCERPLGGSSISGTDDWVGSVAVGPLGVRLCSYFATVHPAAPARAKSKPSSSQPVMPPAMILTGRPSSASRSAPLVAPLQCGPAQ